jgi:hypothetical protein
MLKNFCNLSDPIYNTTNCKQQYKKEGVFMRKSIILAGVICIFVCLTCPTALGVQYYDPFIGYSVDSYPIGIVSADFNGDGNPGLVTANNQGSSVSVLLGNGDGTFATRVNYDTGSSQYPYSVDTGDMDGDGIIDIVTGGSMGIVIFYGVGDGTFSEANVDYFGQSVTVLVDKYLEAGVKKVSWSGVDASGEKVTSGIYFYRIIADQFVDSKTMLLLK